MVITLTGENDFTRRRELKKLVDEFVAEQGDLALERLDGAETEFGRIHETLTGLPFLASKKMIVLADPSKSKQFAEQAEQLLSALPDTTELILYEPKFDKRSSLYKYLKKRSDFREFGALDHAALARWAVQEAKKLDATLSQSDARYLVERIGPNQQLLAGEVEKLSLAGGTIDRSRIDELTEATAQSTIFQLIDAALRGDRRTAMRLYEEQRSLKVEPQQIISMFAWQLHVMALVKTAGNRSNDQIAKQAGINPYVVGKTATLVRGMHLATVSAKIDELLAIDVRSKRSALDLDDALRQFIIELA